MPYLSNITEDNLRAMAREASLAFQRGEASPTDAVIKIASQASTPLTSEHIKRICEMTYHNIFETSFRDQPGPDRLVSFDPPDAVKAASAVRVTQLQSFSDKVGAARTGGVEMDKTASAVPAVSAPRNAFLLAMARAPADRTTMRKEAQNTVRRTRDQLREAASSLEAQLVGARSSEKVAFLGLVDGVVQAVRSGVPPTSAVEACLEFAKVADTSDEILGGIASDLFGALARAGVRLDTKHASFDVSFVPNERHPLRAQAIKVAELREFSVRGALALQDIRTQGAKVERELRNDFC